MKAGAVVVTWRMVWQKNTRNGLPLLAAYIYTYSLLPCRLLQQLMATAYTSWRRYIIIIIIIHTERHTSRYHAVVVMAYHFCYCCLPFTHATCHYHEQHVTIVCLSLYYTHMQYGEHYRYIYQYYYYIHYQHATLRCHMSSSLLTGLRH